jgi:CheY-like chemotaxis protein
MAVLGNLDMAMADLHRLRDRPELADVIEGLRDAREAGERVRNIVRDLKIFSRTDEETRSNVEPQRVIESSLRMVWNEIRHRAKLVRKLEPVPEVYANESRLGQVVLNLIVNAAQAIPEGRTDSNEICVATSRAKDGRVRISVSDTGCGMSQETAEKIFTPFFTTKPIGIGTGLGLSICHQIVTALGGQIEVETELGRGTTFHVLLPALATTAEELVSTAGRILGSKRRGRILVIDDEAVITTTVRRCLRADHDVSSTQDPAIALEMFRRDEEFDVIFCDLMMPNITGMDLYDEIVQIAPDQASRIIFITGGAFTPAARAFLDRTKNSVIEKPIEVEQLRTVVNERIRALDRKDLS